MQVVLQKVDRRSKPIKKQEKIVNKNLQKKQIFLEEENFDILRLLQKNDGIKVNNKDNANKEKKSEFAKPMSILKSKPLKSEKDLIKKNSAKDKKVSKPNF